MNKRTELDSRRVTPRVLGAATVTIVGGVVMVNGQPVSAATFTVTNNNDAGAGSLRQAVIDANQSAGLDEITFDPAVTGTITLASRIGIYDDLRLLGPGEAVLTLTNATGDVLYVYGHDLYLSNITVDGAGDDGIEVYDAGDVVLDTVTVSGSSDNGLEMYESGSLTLIDSTISGSENNGIRASYVGDIDIQGTDIIDNGVNSYGSGNDGIYASYISGTVTITDSTISRNGDDNIDLTQVSGALEITGTTASSSGDDGLDIRDVGGASTISGSTFSDNGDNGIEADNLYDDLAITDVTASDNGTFYDTYGYGDGINVETVDGNITVSGTTASGNANSGSVLYEVEGTVAVSGSTFSGNDDEGLDVRDVRGAVTVDQVTADENGDDGIDFSDLGVPATIERSTTADNDQSGIELDEADATVINSTVSGNGIDYMSEENGLDPRSGIDLYESDLTVEHSTIVDNGAFGIEGDDNLYSDGSTAEDVTLDHTILTGNLAGDVAELESATADHSLLDTGSALTASGTANIETGDALLDPLADNGGPTRTRLPQADSPAVEGGNPAIAGAPATDQRGEPRIVDIIDIGAVEIEAEPPPTTTTTTTTTTPTTVPTPPTTDTGGGPVTLPPTGDDSTGALAWIAGLFLALGAAATRLARRTTGS